MDRFSEKIWEFLILQPQFVIYRGLDNSKTEPGTELDSFSLQTIAKEKIFWTQLQRELSNVDCNTFSGDEKVNYLIIKYYLDTIVLGLKYECYLMPLSYYCHPVITFYLFTLSRLHFNTVKDYQRYIKLLANLPKQMNEFIEVLKVGLERKILSHLVSLGHSLFAKVEEIVGSGPEDSALLSPFRQNNCLFGEELSEVRKQAENLLQQQIVPSVNQFNEFVRKEYMPHLRVEEVSINSLPCPEGLPSRYASLFKFYCDVDTPPQDCHRMALQEVSRLQQRIKEVMVQLKFDGSIREFSNYVHSKEEYFFNNEDEVIEYSENYYKSVIGPKILEVFNHTSHLPLIFKKDIGRSPAKAIYSAPSDDDLHPAFLMMGVSHYKNFRKFEIPTLMLHETDPGHHLQACYAMRNKTLPKFRTNKDDRYYYFAPGRVPLNAAYTEGWGLYCEELGEELGMYADPYSLFGYLSSNLGRCARVVVDTGIHALRWTRGQAKEYMLKNTTLSEDSIEGEIDRYITWPGQACSYTMGHLEIIRLRKLTQQRLGTSFDMKEFHDVMLSCGQVPLSVLATIIDDYVKEKLNS